MSTPLRFGRLEILPQERQLRVDGQRAALGARAFDLLIALVERRERTVSRAELLDLVWPGVVVEEANLQVQVSGLRKVLGHEAIATIPGRGYRFALSDDAATDRVEPSTDPPAGTAAASSAAMSVAAGLPPPIEHLFGRDDDLDALGRLLDAHRLVTVLGAGGIGKTTLAVAAARAQAARGVPVAWVELAPITDASLLPQAIARSMKLPMGPGDPLQALCLSLREVRTLLVLDNAEHLLEAVATVVEALQAMAPQVRLLVTSQAPLKLEAEWQFRVGALAVPPADATVDEALRHGAVALFAARARMADRHFAVDADNLPRVIDLCRQLDGLPLAIRLAAARVRTLGLAALHAQLAERFDLLGGGGRFAPSRHQTLRATHDWSFGLLLPQEQLLLRRLGVFADGFTLDSALAVAAEPGTGRWQLVDELEVLVERSFLMVDDRPQPRYRLLDSARAYALERLGQAGELAATQRRHALRMLALLEQSARDDHSDLPDSAWMARYPGELDDIRAALAWTQQHEPSLALELLGSSRALFFMLGLLQEAESWLCRIGPLLKEDTPPATRARLASFSFLAADPLLSADDAALLAVDCCRASRDRAALYFALMNGLLSDRLSSADRQAYLAEMQGLVEPHWPERTRMVTRIAAAIVDALDGRLEPARDAFIACTAQARRLGKFRLVARLLSWLAAIESSLGAHADAVVHAQDAAALTLAHGTSNRHSTLIVLLSVQLGARELAAARETIETLFALLQRTCWYGFAKLPLRLALYAALEGRPRDAAQLAGLSDRLAPDLGDLLTDRERAELNALLAGHLTPAERELAQTEGASLDPAGAAVRTLRAAA